MIERVFWKENKCGRPKGQRGQRREGGTEHAPILVIGGLDGKDRSREKGKEGEREWKRNKEREMKREREREATTATMHS